MNFFAWLCAWQCVLCYSVVLSRLLCAQGFVVTCFVLCELYVVLCV